MVPSSKQHHSLQKGRYKQRRYAHRVGLDCNRIEKLVRLFARPLGVQVVARYLIGERWSVEVAGKMHVAVRGFEQRHSWSSGEVVHECVRLLVVFSTEWGMFAPEGILKKWRHSLGEGRLLSRPRRPQAATETQLGVLDTFEQLVTVIVIQQSESRDG